MTLELPPRRPLPPQVRDRMRRRVLGVGGRARHRLSEVGEHLVLPLAAAAVAGVLVAGGLFVALRSSHAGDSSSVGPPSGAPTFRSGGRLAARTDNRPEDADRCGFAVVDVWSTFTLNGRRLVVAGGDRFCELTYTRVSHNRPGVEAVELGQGVLALWRSPTGVLVGRTPAGAVPPGADAPTADPRAAELFVLAPGPARVAFDFTANGQAVRVEADLDRLPGAEWSDSVEHLPPGDAVVARCLDRALQDGATWVGDPGRWLPGADVGPAAHRVLLLRGGEEVVYCQVADDQAVAVHPANRPGTVLLPFSFRYRVDGTVLAQPDGGYVVLAGTVDQARVGALEVADSRGVGGQVSVVAGTFAVWIGGQPVVGGAPDSGFRVRVRDHRGEVVYQDQLG
ncbi:hypothetical protein [Saccharothrix syringae]|uniref:Uncharacterized protein n=1 Tax=Saccharothrix syringae TaxID=103733 RepID=A0A5Q0H7W8_SACSY|nr:hypothetical protein [Saccharothrix syringae]QFZ22073.1 hypothetical protein EKG83_35870 [Saccharothrix syringae]